MQCCSRVKESCWGIFLTHCLLVRRPPRPERFLRRGLHRRHRRRAVESDADDDGNDGVDEHEGVDRRRGQGDPAQDVESHQHGEDAAAVIGRRISVKKNINSDSQVVQGKVFLYQMENWLVLLSTRKSVRFFSLRSMLSSTPSQSSTRELWQEKKDYKYFKIFGC